MEEISLEEFRNIEIEILVEIDKICRENNLKYSLGYGSLLGAVRHKGFIPWDDDIDVIMTRKDYMKLIEIFNNKTKNENLRIISIYNEKSYFYPFAKVVDKRTILKEKYVKDNPITGVYVDVFPIDGLPDDKKEAKKLLDKVNFYKKASFLTYDYCINKYFTFKRMFKYILSIIPRIIGPKYWLNKIENIISQNDYTNCKLSGCITGPVHIRNEFIDSKSFDEQINLDFEGHKIMAIKNYKQYLKNIYGDYMTYPPKEKQVLTHSFTAYWRK